jgi:hypothetical protein
MPAPGPHYRPRISWRLVIRTGPKVARRRFEGVDEALDALEEECRAAATTTRVGTVRGIGRDYAPEQQVATRAELSGPRGARGGVDVHGDGSVAAYTGRLRRRPLGLAAGESPYAALRRALSGSVSVEP